MKTYRLGEVVELRRQWIEVDPLSSYVNVGVRSFGRGLFHYEPTPGPELSRLRFHELQPGALVVSNIKAWEGAVGVATEREAGCITSNRMLTYFPRDPDQVDIPYLMYFLISEKGTSLLGRASPGSADRNRTLSIDRFEALQIALPRIEEQRRVAKKLIKVGRGLEALDIFISRTEQLRPLAVEGSIQTVLKRVSRAVPLSTVAEVNPSPARLPENEPVVFVPMAAVEAVDGIIATSDTRLAGEIGNGYKQFRRGDVIFARITPSMQNGKAAVADIPTFYGYGSTEFHVLRPSGDVSPEWLHTIVRTLGFRENARRYFTGTAGQQRVPASFMQEVMIPVPPTVQEQAELLREIDMLTGVGKQVRRLRVLQRARTDALRASALNHAFNGQL